MTARNQRDNVSSTFRNVLKTRSETENVWGNKSLYSYQRCGSLPHEHVY